VRFLADAEQKIPAARAAKHVVAKQEAGAAEHADFAAMRMIADDFPYTLRQIVGHAWTSAL
jgi:hypothetical protein